MHGSAPNLVHVQYRRQILASRGAKESFRGHNIASDRLGKTLATAPPIGANFSCGGPCPQALPLHRCSSGTLDNFFWWSVEGYRFCSRSKFALFNRQAKSPLTLVLLLPFNGHFPRWIWVNWFLWIPLLHLPEENPWGLVAWVFYGLGARYTKKILGKILSLAQDFTKCILSYEGKIFIDFYM